MREDVLPRAGAADPLDQRTVVVRVGEDNNARHRGNQRAQRLEIRHVAAREDQRTLFAMPGGEPAFQLDVRRTAARDVSRPAAAGAVLPGGGNLRLHDRRMLTQAQIVVTAPDLHLPPTVHRISALGSNMRTGNEVAV